MDYIQSQAVARPLASRQDQIFALIIGINEYPFLPDYPPLSGAVSDADKLCVFLIDHLGVPPENITNLRNAQATRTNIISQITSLSIDERIRPGAEVVIYFAGHGARTSKPSHWDDWTTVENKVEMICPADVGEVDNGVARTGIPDRTLHYLLDQLSRSVGSNIVRYSFHFMCMF